jgi:ParB family transcriptional regulator, chromosome partitioning protein
MTAQLKVVETAMQGTHTPITVPLSSLIASPRNVRTVETNVSELASSILVNNLYMPLIVTKDMKGKKGTGNYAVEAGERRRKALMLLLEQGRIVADFPVSVIVIDITDATNASLIENVQREQMHPADKYKAFSTLINEGKSILEVAVAYGTTELNVRRMLKLASATPEIFAEYKAGNMSLEQIMVLCQVDDHQQQNELWFSTPDGHMRSANNLKKRITQEEMSATDKRVKYVGFDNYVSAGGRVRADLFSSNHEGDTILDADVLETLVYAKSLIDGDIIKAEGWGWVEFSESQDWEYIHRFKRLSTVSRDLTEEEQKRIVEIEAEIESMEGTIEALPSEDDEAYTEESEATYEQVSDAIRTLEREAEKINEGAEVWPETKKVAGVYYYLNHEGVIVRNDGLLKAEDYKKLRAEDSNQEGSSNVSAEAEAKKDDLSNSLQDTLKAYRTGAVQLCVARQPELALIVLTHSLALNVLPTYQFNKWGKSAVKVSSSMATVGSVIPDYQTTELYQDREYLNVYWCGLLPEKADDLLDWIKAQSNDVVMALLAYCTSLSVDLNESSSKHFEIYTHLFKVNMHEFWKPTADNYFKRVAKGHMLEVAEQANVDVTNIDKDKLKKSDMAERIGEKVEKTDWLPSILKA